jgi:hypothetical protein
MANPTTITNESNSDEHVRRRDLQKQRTGRRGEEAKRRGREGEET